MDHKALYVHWGFIQMSVTNAIIIALMFCLFLAALLIPFPGDHGLQPGEQRTQEDRGAQA